MIRTLLWGPASLILFSALVLASPETGVLLQPIGLAETPEVWYLEDADTGKTVASIEGGWGAVAVAPGHYRVFLRPQGRDAFAVQWSEVSVVEGELTRVAIDSGIRLSGTRQWPSEPEWWLVDNAAGRRVAQVHKRWGFTPLPAGSYCLTVIPERPLQQVEWTALDVEAGKITQVALDTGLVLDPGDFEVSPPGILNVSDHRGRVVTQVLTRWGFQPVPPGHYELAIPTDHGTAKSEVDLAPGEIKHLTLADLGVGRVLVGWQHGWPRLVGPPGIGELRLTEGNTYWSLPSPSSDSAEIGIWGIAGSRLALVLRNGVVQIEQPLTFEAGKETRIGLDLDVLIRDLGLSAFALGSLDDGPETDPAGGELLVAEGIGNAPLMMRAVAGGSVWIAPANAYLRWRRGDAETIVDVLPRGVVTSVSAPALPGGLDQSTGIRVDVVIQEPADGAVVQADELDLVGRATTGAEAGTTQVAILIDTSNSTAEPCGLDLDGDGGEESILAAEVAAARVLVEGLSRLEAESPGDAFAVGLLRFSTSAEHMTPLMRLGDPSAMASLMTSLDILLRRGPDGNTRYDSGLDAAVGMIESAGMRGPRVVILMSDGKPNDTSPALAAAVRAGRLGATIYGLGLGKDFTGSVSAGQTYPPIPQRGVDILGLMSALGHSGGEIFPTPRPGDAVSVLGRLPVLKPVEVELKSLDVDNLTLARPALSVSVTADGSFAARVPVSLLPAGEHEENTLRATATATGGRGQAVDEVRVRAPREKIDAEHRRAIETLERTAGELRAEVSTLSQKLDDCRASQTKRTDSLTLALDDARSALTGCREEVLRVTGQVERQGAALSKTEARLGRLIQDKDALVAEAAESREHVHRLEQSLRGTEASLADCRSKQQSLSRTCDELRASARAREQSSDAEGSRCRSELEAARQAKAMSESRLAALGSECDADKAEIDVERRARVHAEGELLAMAEQQRSAEQRIASQQQALETLRECDSRLRTAEKDLESRTDEIDQLSRLLVAAEQGCGACREETTRLEGENQRLTSALSLCPELPGRIRVTAATAGASDTVGTTSIPKALLPDVELILDMSNSMWGRIDGEPKIAIARRAISNVISELPKDIRVALRVYGHRQGYRDAGACHDTELLVPLDILDSPRLLGEIHALSPRGKTPIAFSLGQVASDFRGVPGNKVVVLVTDGEEECGGDPLKAAQSLAEQGMDVIVHIVGFALSDDDAKAMMRRVAEATGGRFIDAQSPNELEQAVSKSFRVDVRVLGADGDPVAEGVVDDDIEVPPGTYRVEVNAPRGLIHFDEVEVTADDTRVLTIERRP